MVATVEASAAELGMTMEARGMYRAGEDHAHRGRTRAVLHVGCWTRVGASMEPIGAFLEPLEVNLQVGGRASE